jgi:hypothetical protein
VSSYGMAELCDASETSLLTILQEVHAKISDHYGCSVNLNQKRCTPFELAAKQFLNSSLTLNPLARYPAALTGHAWN